METNKVRWGVIGSGGIARRRTIPEGLVPAENASLVAVYDIDPAVNREVSEEFGVEAAGSIGDLLSMDVDAVYLATPVSKHLEQVAACAEAGKHVLCEKPLGLSVREAEEIIGVCRSKGVILGIGLMMRFVEQHRAALKLIKEDRLGIPVYGRAQLSCWYPPMEKDWRQDPKLGGGGALMDMGSHCIDLLEMFFGEIKKVSCFINNQVHEYPSEDSAVAMLYFHSGALATVDSLFNVPDNCVKNALELYGSKGSILASYTIGQGPGGEMKAILESGPAGYDAQQERADGQEMDINPEQVNTYLAEVTEFGNAILEGREPHNSAQKGIRNQKVLAACYESAKSGKVIEL